MPFTVSRPRKTVADYLALPDEVRAELLAGDLYVTPAPSADHQRTVQNLYVLLRDHVLIHAAGEVFVAPLDVHLPNGDIGQPDLLFVSKESANIVQDCVRGVPGLLVEVVSAAHAERDRAVKRGVYERSGVPEYWIVDPDERSIEVLRYDGSRYQPAGFHMREGTLRSRTLPGLALPLERVFPRRMER